MRNITFEFGGENLQVILRGNEVLFFDISSGTATTLEGLRLSKSGVIKEFPDLEEDTEWRKKAIERFKQKVKELKTEENRMDYVIYELSQHGYKALFYQVAGFRPKKIQEVA